ncbi:meiosis-specific protein ASY1 [Impatiens glandulifera]|uniref:meiosis-specific protein ASY1 n=1 Tax=Impatiens glandulifera TaxID=253017 RepID=UPI001FB08AC3|nr:meiosis-specific protein ASY1 [Impatiens glandulifera]
MVVAQKLKEAEITEQDSLLLTRNLLRIAIFNISYIRGLFPEKYFNDKSVPALEMKIKKLMPMDADSRRLIDWMEKGVYDALQKKYLKTLLFCICEAIEGPMIEEYAFSFCYSSSDSQEVSMNINRTGYKEGGTVKCKSMSEVTPSQMRSSACKMVRTLIQLMRTLDKMPEERTILMKLLYYDDVTPADYEPPFFRGCTEEEAHNAWTKNPLKMEVGNVNSKHFVLALRVKSVLDPCEDENDEIQDDDASLGANSGQRDDYSDSDSEVSHSPGKQYYVAPVDKHHDQGETGLIDEDDTQDPEEDEQQLSKIRNWINSHHRDTLEITDFLASFPEISTVLIEEIMEKLVREGIMFKNETDGFTIKKQQNSEYEFDVVKEEANENINAVFDKAQHEDHMYMKALYHALPMKYVTVTKLQSMLEDVNQYTIRKLIDKMAMDGFVETKGSRRLGKRVIQSDHTEKKLIEVKKALKVDLMDLDTNNSNMKMKSAEYQSAGSNLRDISTCGALRSIGSDVTRTKERSDLHQNGSTRSEQTISKGRERGNTPITRVEPVPSRESFVPGNENGRAKSKNINDGDAVICSWSNEVKRSRKASMVEDHILQSIKRPKAAL